MPGTRNHIVAPSSLVHPVVIRIFPPKKNASFKQSVERDIPQGVYIASAFRQPETCLKHTQAASSNPGAILISSGWSNKLARSAYCARSGCRAKNILMGQQIALVIWISPRDPFPIVHQWGGHSSPWFLLRKLSTLDNELHSTWEISPSNSDPTEWFHYSGSLDQWDRNIRV